MSLTNIKLRLAENVALSNTLSKYFDSRCLDVEVCKTCISQQFFHIQAFIWNASLKWIACGISLHKHASTHACTHTEKSEIHIQKEM